MSQETLDHTALAFEHLAHRPEFIETVAQWWFDHDQQQRRKTTFAQSADLDATTRALHGCLQTDDIPQVITATVFGEVIGAVGLFDNDQLQGVDLAPWVANVYVHPDYRGHAVGSLLMKAVEAKATSMGLPTLYAKSTTRDHAAFLEKNGYTVHDISQKIGGKILIFYKELS